MHNNQTTQPTNQIGQKGSLDGWLLINKSAGVTSRKAIDPVGRILRKIFPDKKQKLPKFGHAGTLDSFAEGLLPVAIGKATKCIRFANDGKKIYKLLVAWGKQTDTDDPIGEVIATSDKRPSPEALEQAIQKYIGEIDQMPPDFSALKIKGVRAYNLARKGEKPELKSRKVQIYSIKQVPHDGDNNFSALEVMCGKGTYMRALARDLGHDLGCFGHLHYLQRTRVGSFSLDKALTFDKIREILEAETNEAVSMLNSFLLPFGAGLDGLSSIELDRSQLRSLHLGIDLDIDKSLFLDQKEHLLTNTVEGGWVQVINEGVFSALAVFEHSKLKLYRSFI